MKKSIPKRESKDVNVNAKAAVDRLLGDENTGLNPDKKKKITTNKKPK